MTLVNADYDLFKVGVYKRAAINIITNSIPITALKIWLSLCEDVLGIDIEQN